MIDPWVPLTKVIENIFFYMSWRFTSSTLNHVKHIWVCSFGLETKLISFPDVKPTVRGPVRIFPCLLIVIVLLYNIQ